MGLMSECAVQGCGRNVHRDDIWLERISPKGKGCPFVGVCQNHPDGAYLLTDAANSAMDEAERNANH